jgi:hypothetical protein
MATPYNRSEVGKCHTIDQAKEKYIVDYAEQ